MAITSESKKVQEDGQEKDAITLTFTNGAKAQLEELKTFLKSASELDVVKLGISILQNYKEEKGKKEKQNVPEE